MIAAMLIMRRIAARICDPVAKCTERLETLAQGDLTSEVPVFKRRNEIGRLSDATATIVSQISGVISDLSTNLDNISEGDFTCEASDPSHYIGDYADTYYHEAGYKTDGVLFLYSYEDNEGYILPVGTEARSIVA